eukprot:Rmarinus@m.26302
MLSNFSPSFVDPALSGLSTTAFAFAPTLHAPQSIHVNSNKAIEVPISDHTKHCERCNGIDISREDDNGFGLLRAATIDASLDCVKYLLSIGAQPFDDFGGTILHLATLEGNLPIIKYLVDMYGLDVNHTTVDGWTVLHAAAFDSQVEAIRYFVEEKEVDPTVIDDFGRNALDLAKESHAAKPCIDYLEGRICK